MTQFKSTDGRQEKPMGLSQVLELMTEARKIKAETDRVNLGSGKRPPPFPEFFMDFMTAKFGSRTEAVANCNKLLLGLLRMYRSRHGLSVFYVRLLRMYHPTPIPYALSISTLQLAEGFMPLAETCAAAKIAKGSSPAELHQTGGEAFLVPLMDMILNLFEGQPLVSRLVLQGLVLNTEQLRDFRKLKLSFALKRYNCSVDKLLGAATQINKTQFATQVATTLETIFSQQEAELLYDAITSAPTAAKAEVKKAVAEINLAEATTSEKWVVPLSTYLCALADTYHYLVREHVFKVQNLLKSFAWKTVTLDNFNQLARGVDIAVPAEVTQSWYDEARGTQPELTPEAAARVLVRFPVTIRPPLVPAELSTATLVVTISEVTTTSRKVVTTTTTVTKKLLVKKAKK